MTAKKVTQTAKKAEDVKINAPAKTVETAKTTTTAVSAAKKEEPKAEALKKEEKAAPVKAEAEKKETVKKETVKKETAKKTTARKTAKAEKPAAVHNVYVQFAGKEVLTSALTELVTEKWVAMGHRASSIKTLDLYVKPEDGAAYYVINGKETGKIEL